MQILDTNPQLHFHLQQQKLIELIRAGKVNEALEFAQEELATRGMENVSYNKIIFLVISLRVELKPIRLTMQYLRLAEFCFGN